MHFNQRSQALRREPTRTSRRARQGLAKQPGEALNVPQHVERTRGGIVLTGVNGRRRGAVASTTLEATGGVGPQVGSAGYTPRVGQHPGVVVGWCGDEAAPPSVRATKGRARKGRTGGGSSTREGGACSRRFGPSAGLCQPVAAVGSCRCVSGRAPRGSRSGRACLSSYILASAR